MRFALLMVVLLSAPHKAGKAAPKFEVPQFDALPTGVEVSSNTNKDSDILEPKGPVEASYSIVRVEHERASGHPLVSIPMSEVTSKSEPFSSLIRLKAAQKTHARIDVSLLDAKGVPLVSHSGLVDFKNSKTDTTDYVIRWHAFSVPEPGSYQMKIELDGKEMGKWPLRFAVAQK